MQTDRPLRAALTDTFATAASADSPALDRVVPRIYEELRAMARRQMGRERRQMTWQPTDLVHEAYLRLVEDERVTRRGRAYFFAAAARAMRRVLIESARRRGAAKRGAGQALVTLDDGVAAVDAYALELLDLDAALHALERINARQARVVECRYFGGLSVEETAAALDVSPRTVKGDWAQARAWLYSELRGASEGSTE